MKRRLTIRGQLFSLVALTIVACLLSAGVLWFRWATSETEEYLKSRATVLADSAAVSIGLPLATGDEAPALAFIEQMMKQDDVRYVVVEGSLRAEAFQQNRGITDACAAGSKAACDGRIFEQSAPMVLPQLGDDELPDMEVPSSDVGSIRVGVSSEAAERRMAEQLRSGLLIVVAVGALVLLLTLLIASRITGPVGALERAADLIARGDLDQRVVARGGQEIAALGHSFNHMAAELRTATRSLGQSLEKMQIIQDTLGDLLFVVRAGGRVVVANRAFVQATGLDPAGSKLLHSVDFLDEEFASNLGVLAQYGGRDVDAQIKASDGELIPVHMSCSSIPDPSGERDHILCVARDLRALRSAVELATTQAQLEERERTEAELREARNVAVEASALKSRFLANMSHEIRTPMNGIVGMTTLLEDTRLDAEQKDCTKTIRYSADHLLGVINDILDFSKLEAGKVDIEIIDFSIEEELQQVMKLLEPRAKADNVAVTWTVDPSIPEFVAGDPVRLRQILVNIVGNAVKFSPRGAVEVAVEPANSSQGGLELAFEVRDTGVGIKPEALRHLFDPFTQADDSTTRKFGGTGLGLSISRQLVELMGGEIGAKSTLGTGSTFRFTVHLQEAENQEAAVSAEPALTRNDPSVDIETVKVLLAEDNPVNAKVALRFLERIGVHADLVVDGAEAVAAHQAMTYDIIFMDCQMPVLDGFDATKQIRALPNGDAPIIIAMTANAMKGDREACLAVGMDDYVAKPIERSILDEKMGVWARVVIRQRAMERRAGAQGVSPPSRASVRAATPDLN